MKTRFGRALLLAALVALAVVQVAGAATDGYETRELKTTIIGALFKTTPSTLANGEYDALRVDSSGNLKVSLSGSSGTSSVNVAQINGVTPLMGAGNTGTGSPRVTIASDQASIPVAATLQAGSALAGGMRLSVLPQEALTNSGVVTSNGATAVNIRAAAAGSVYVGGVTIQNLSTSATHTAQLLSSGGTVLRQFVLGPLGWKDFTAEDRIVTVASEGLQFKFTDGTGAVGDLTATAQTLQQ